MAKFSALGELVDEAATVVQKLQKLDQNRKLTYAAFLAEAINLADTTREGVDKLDADLDSKFGMDSARSFVAKLVRVFREPLYPRCPTNTGKVLNAYGSSEAFPELTGIGATVAMAMAVAVLRVHRKYGDEAFGVIENWDTYEKESTDLRDRIATIYEQMREVVSGKDLIIDVSEDRLFPDERKRGLAHVSFNLARDINLSENEWPQQLVADAVANAPAPKVKREKLTKAA